MRSHVTPIFLGACESWTLTAEPQRRKLAMEMRCYRKILRISYKDHVTKEEVRAKIQQAIGPHEDLLTIVKRCRLQWYGHVSCSSGLAKTILQGTVKGGKSSRAGSSTTEQIFNLQIPCEKISPAPARPLPCLHRLQEGLQKGLASSFVSYEEIQHQHKPYPSHQKPL